MRDGMLGLQDIITSMMQGAYDQDQAWLRAAHFIMGRIHRFCTSLRPEILSADISLQEEREAANRAKSVRKGSATSSSKSDSHTPNHGSSGKNKRSNPSIHHGHPHPTRTRTDPQGCIFHNGAPHSIYECDKFLGYVRNMENRQAPTKDALPKKG